MALPHVSDFAVRNLTSGRNMIPTIGDNDKINVLVIVSIIQVAAP